MFTSVVIISSFTAAIASSLTVTQLENAVKGPQDLPRVRVATVSASTSQEYLTRNRIQYTTYGTPQESLNAILAGEVDAVVYDAPVLKYLVNKNMQGSVKVLPQTFERQYYAVGLTEGSELRLFQQQGLRAKLSLRAIKPRLAVDYESDALFKFVAPIAEVVWAKDGERVVDRYPNDHLLDRVRAESFIDRLTWEQ